MVICLLFLKFSECEFRVKGLGTSIFVLQSDYCHRSIGDTVIEGLLQKAALWPCGQWPYGLRFFYLCCATVNLDLYQTLHPANVLDVAKPAWAPTLAAN